MNARYLRSFGSALDKHAKTLVFQEIIAGRTHSPSGGTGMTHGLRDKSNKRVICSQCIRILELKASYTISSL